MILPLKQLVTDSTGWCISNGNRLEVGILFALYERNAHEHRKHKRQASHPPHKQTNKKATASSFLASSSLRCHAIERRGHNQLHVLDVQPDIHSIPNEHTRRTA
mmetsp:Transcript_20450/g.41222  ORF Transcript_20450/g.41222 Transcript_20450/m.41222 type:complete len:104 (-) Transcript_20450:125-436(-)